MQQFIETATKEEIKVVNLSFKSNNMESTDFFGQ
jgi:hypothetical protein